MKTRMGVALAVVGVIGLLVYLQWFRRDHYVTSSLSDYMTVSRPLVGNPRVLEAGMQGRYMDVAVTVATTSQGLRLKYTSETERPNGGSWKSVQEYDLIPSKAFRGDYDTVHFRMYMEPMEQLVNFGGDYELPTPHLHRVPDERAFRYIDGAYAVGRGETDETTESLTQLARDLAAAYPDDPYMQIMVADALVREGRLDELPPVLIKLEQFGDSGKSRAALYHATQVRAALRWNELAKQGRNGYDVINRIVHSGLDLNARAALVPELLKYEVAATPPYAVGQEGLMRNFLDHQVTVKVMRERAMLLLLEGKRAEALQLAAGCYRMGQLMNQDQVSVVRLIAAALRAIANTALGIFMLNACETPEEMQTFWQTLEELNRLEPSSGSGITNSPTVETVADAEERVIREKVSDARFQTVRLVSAARYRLLQSGRFPTNAQEFAPLLAAGPPLDPFTSEPMRFAAEDPYRCYSVGPDKDDDLGTLVYDSTNGTVSSGDIVTTIPRQREYPYPREGVRANSPADVMKIFPYGLPPDSFADRRGMGMRISNSTPVYIYSVGPDTDSGPIDKIGDSYVPTVQFDPTNGVTSKGDIFLALPAAP